MIGRLSAWVEMQFDRAVTEEGKANRWSSERQQACLIGRVVTEEGKAKEEEDTVNPFYKLC